MTGNGYVKTIKKLDELNDNYSILKINKEGCRTCDQLKPVFEKFAEKYAGRFNCYEANVVDVLELVPRCNIQSFPYLVLFKDRQILDGFVGARFAGGIGGERVAVELENLEKMVNVKMKRWLDSE